MCLPGWIHLYELSMPCDHHIVHATLCMQIVTSVKAYELQVVRDDGEQRMWDTQAAGLTLLALLALLIDSG